MKEFIRKIKDKENLYTEEAYKAMLTILESANDEDIYDFLIAMNEKKEVTVDELVGFVKGMKEKATIIEPNVENLVDTCGTGGDKSGTINISTGAAILAASAGIPVAKHGNYSITSRSGSADVLEALGYNIHMSAENCKKMIEKTNFGFLLAPKFHPAMGRVAAVRRRIAKEKKQKTIFNQIGPLCNPAKAKGQIIGVYHESLCEIFPYVLKETDVEDALIVHGDGLDEITTTGETLVYELREGSVLPPYRIKPEDFGIMRCGKEDIQGGLPIDNAKDIRDIFWGKKGAKRDILVMNAGPAIYLAGLVNSLEEGVKKAQEAIDSGASLEKLTEIVKYSKIL